MCIGITGILRNVVKFLSHEAIAFFNFFFIAMVNMHKGTNYGMCMVQLP